MIVTICDFENHFQDKFLDEIWIDLGVRARVVREEGQECPGSCIQRGALEGDQPLLCQRLVTADRLSP